MTITHMTIGANVDFDAYLKKNLGGGPAGKWPVNKLAKIGERVVILIPSMHGDLRAHGRVGGEPIRGNWGNSIRYFVPVVELQAIKPSIPISLVQQTFPDWSWTSYARSFTTVPIEIEHSFWELVNDPPAVAYDTAEPPARIETVVSRIIRDSRKANELKALYEFKCQICGVALQYGEEKFYAEVHHLRPLGSPHDGADSNTNMMVLCPNHHALFDLAVPQFLSPTTLEINGERIQLTQKHRLAKTNIDYYMKSVRPTR
ncbi:MAG: hypothetical protein ACI9HK_005954 [Pirellulaceae bacterium]|jgi:hypothetical protein